MDIGGNLHSIDIKSGESSYIGSTGQTHYYWSAMAIDSQGRVFASFGTYSAAFLIYEINPSTGRGISSIQTNLFGISGLAFDDNDVLYAINDRDAPLSTRYMDLYQIDLTTGGTTLIGYTGIRNALALDFYDGSLWTYNLGKGLQKIDPVSGIGSDVSPWIVGPIGSTISLCINDAGTMYYVDGGLWMVDRDKGSFSLVRAIYPFGWWAEAVFVEGPDPPQSLWLAGQSEGPVGVKVRGVTPGGNVAFLWSEGLGGPSYLPAGSLCPGVELRIAPNYRLATITTANAQGETGIPPMYLPASARRSFRIQAIDLTTCEITNPVMVIF